MALLKRKNAIIENIEEHTRRYRSLLKAVADIPHVMPRPLLQPFLIVFDDLDNTLILFLRKRTPSDCLPCCVAILAHGQVITHRSDLSQRNVAPAVFRCRVLQLEELVSSGVLLIQGVLGLAVPDME